MRRPMLNNSSPGQAVFEPFMGSGTTLIASETTGRVCFGIELKPVYVDVAVERWQQFTDANAVLAETGKALRGARDKGQSARARMMVSAYAARLRLTLATVACEHGGELEAALEVLGLIALKGKVVTADALHCNRRTVAEITEGAAAIIAWR